MTFNHNLTHNNSNISDPSTAPLSSILILFLSPIEPTNIENTNNPTEQMESNKTIFESSDNNDVPSQIQKPWQQSISTPPPSKNKYDIMKYLILFFSLLPYIRHSSLQKIRFQHKEMTISYQFSQTTISLPNPNLHHCICTLQTTPSNFRTNIKISSLPVLRNKGILIIIVLTITLKFSHFSLISSDHRSII